MIDENDFEWNPHHDEDGDEPLRVAVQIHPAGTKLSQDEATTLIGAIVRAYGLRVKAIVVVG